jgi:DNA-binding response OmpR family regulator
MEDARRPQGDRRVVLVDDHEVDREVLARRLRAQGYSVETAQDGAVGADLALRSPPSAVVADLWMAGISGIQLCQLLRREPATAGVPVILRGPTDDPRARFWAERAGACAYVAKGRTGELDAPLHAPGFERLARGDRPSRPGSWAAGGQRQIPDRRSA